MDDLRTTKKRNDARRAKRRKDRRAASSTPGSTSICVPPTLTPNHDLAGRQRNAFGPTERTTAGTQNRRLTRPAPSLGNLQVSGQGGLPIRGRNDNDTSYSRNRGTQQGNPLRFATRNNDSESYFDDSFSENSYSTNTGRTSSRSSQYSSDLSDTQESNADRRKRATDHVYDTRKRNIPRSRTPSGYSSSHSDESVQMTSSGNNTRRTKSSRRVRWYEFWRNRILEIYMLGLTIQICAIGKTMIIMYPSLVS